MDRSLYQTGSPLKEKAIIDYAVISHFHDDHFGSWYPSAPLSADGKYALTGITGVASQDSGILFGYPGL